MVISKIVNTKMYAGVTHTLHETSRVGCVTLYAPLNYITLPHFDLPVSEPSHSPTNTQTLGPLQMPGFKDRSDSNNLQA